MPRRAIFERSRKIGWYGGNLCRGKHSCFAEINSQSTECGYTVPSPAPPEVGRIRNAIIDMQHAPPVRRAVPTLWWLTFAALIAILLIPLFLTEIPPLLDYPNHLARMDILFRLPDDADLARIYGTSWRIVPNIGIDIAMPALMHVMPLMAVGKVFVGLALILPLIGVIALHRVAFRTVSYWPLAAGLVAYNRLFFSGFLNFLIGIGLALLGAALWRALQDRSALLRVGTAVVVAVIIFFCHLIAVAFYGLLLLGFELARGWKMPWRDRLMRLVLSAVPFIIPAIFYLRAPISAGTPAGGHGLADAIKHYYWALMASPPGLKTYGLMGPFLTYNRLLDAGALVLVIAVLVLFAVGRRLRVAPALAGIFILLLVAYPAVPFFLMQTAWVDQRLPILAGFLLFAGTLPRVATGRTARLMAVAFAAAILARTAVIGLVWAGHDAQIADFRHVIAPVGPGDRVLVTQAERNADPHAMVNQPDSVRAMRDNDSTMHLPALLVIEHDAFWPLLFTAATKQPVKVIPPYDTISLPEGELPWVGGLADLDPATVKWAPYLPDWQHKFDWVLVMHPGDAPEGYDLLPDRLEPVSAGKIVALYRVKK
jgi:hypothetical protein